MQPYKLPVQYYALVAILLFAANIVIYKNVSAAPVVVHVFAAGKGTIALIEMPRRTLLVDTGPDASILRDLGETLPMWHRSIDAVILTSDKTAQVGGLPILTTRYKVGETLSTGNASLPYGLPITLGSVTLVVIVPGVFRIESAHGVIDVSSTTLPSLYLL